MPPRTDTDPRPGPSTGSLAASVAPSTAGASLVFTARLREPGAALGPILGVSVAAHVLFAVALGALGPIHALVRSHEAFVEVEMAPEPVPAPVVAPPPVPEPVAAPPPNPRVRTLAPAAPTPATPTPVAPTPVEPPPTPVPSSAPPSVDDVFGDDAASQEVMTAGAGAGSFAMDVGGPGGRAGGRGGGTGEVARGGSAPAVESGPSEADRRRARRAYVRSLEGLLSGRVRYPRAAAREHLEGRAELCLRIGTDGRVLGHRICGSTGHDMLDDAAMEAASELGRVPAPPALAAWTPSDEVHAGVVFVIR